MQQVEKYCPPVERDNGPKLRSWVGFLLGPVAASVHLALMYFLSHAACTGRGVMTLHVSSAGALAAAAVACLIAWGRLDGPTTGTATPENKRVRFMALMGIAASIFSGVVISAQWLPLIMGVPCDK